MKNILLMIIIPLVLLSCGSDSHKTESNDNESFYGFPLTTPICVDIVGVETYTDEKFSECVTTTEFKVCVDDEVLEWYTWDPTIGDYQGRYAIYNYGYLRKEFFYVDGLKEGEFRGYSECGELEKIYIYKEGKRVKVIQDTHYNCN